MLISDIIRKELNADCSVLMGANVANDMASDAFCETTIGYKDPKVIRGTRPPPRPAASLRCPSPVHSLSLLCGRSSRLFDRAPLALTLGRSPFPFTSPSRC